MDAFKQTEIERMRLGGNDNWKKFFDEHEDTQMRGLTWDDATIAERYNGGVGEEWKERLSAKVEGREYVPGERKSTPAPAAAKRSAAAGSRSGTPLSGTARASRSQSPAGSPAGKAKVDAKYFESLGAANAARPDGLAPSEGGKYAGFGNTPMPKKEEGLPKLEDLQKDPLAALTKGFGWFSSTVTKTATTVNKDFIQPTTKQVRHASMSRFRMLQVLTRLSDCSSESQISQPRRGLLAAASPHRRRREPKPHRRGSTSSSRVARTATLRSTPKPGRWKRARRHSGTTSRRLRTSGRVEAALLARLRWARGPLEERRPRRARRARMSGTIGDSKLHKYYLSTRRGEYGPRAGGRRGLLDLGLNP